MLVAVGACYLDTILTTSHYPEEDEKLRASSVSRRRGGNCPNTLEVLAQLVSQQDAQDQLRLGLITVLPARSSPASQLIQSELGSRVSLEHCVYREGFEDPASCYIIRSQSTGSRTIVNYNNLPDFTLKELEEKSDRLGSTASWFHFEGRIPDITLLTMRHLRRQFPWVKISVEIEKSGRSGLQALAEEADVVFYAKSWALVSDIVEWHKAQVKVDLSIGQGAGYKTAEECLHAQAALAPSSSLLCCTWGQDGASALQPANGNLVYAPAFTVEGFQVIDPIGAGDTFIAGMLYGLTCRDTEWGLAQKLAFATQLAGMKVSQEGFTGLHRVLVSMKCPL
ncbi:hypothetical protein POX_b03377 [Penicillium oxalicum]|uniref:hypothetical protein n=1 Tax=Penicillium oxalicum TaxID=69781 RepID=UPI0020B8EE5C|nr:hypothetical protein POX_b03377 [Penicillium oxalicum]KAI2793323.1 hypothetical protein POX_b03377 [Penicillium oxalicum]